MSALKRFERLNPGVLPDEATELILKPIFKMPKPLQRKWLPMVTKVPALATPDNVPQNIRTIAAELAKEATGKYYQWISKKCHEVGIQPPSEDENWQNRVQDTRWWELRLRRSHLRKWANLERDAGCVREYVGDRTLHMVTQHVTRGALWLQDKYVTPAEQVSGDLLQPATVTPPFDDEPADWEDTASNDESERLPLAKIAAKAEASRQALNAARLKYLESLMQNQNNAVALVTLTVPGAFRPWRDDPRSIEECREFLTKTCNRVSARIAKLNKKGADIFMVGIKCVQPHQKGTPHAHLVLVTRKEHMATIEKLWREQIMKEHPNEAGAAKHRLDFAIVDYDEGKEKAMRYASRYTSRLTQSKIGEVDFSDIEKAKEKIKEILEAAREDAWYRATGTRRFSWFGLPPAYWWMSISKQAVRDWRQHCPKVERDGKLIPEKGVGDFVETWYKRHFPEIAPLVEAVIKGNYGRFIELSKLHVFEPLKEAKENRYMEGVERTIGVIINGEFEARLSEGEWMIIAEDGGIVYEPVGVITYKPRGDDFFEEVDIYATSPP